MKTHALRKKSTRVGRIGQPLKVRRSQLIENNLPKPYEVFQTWLLHVGASPRAGFPASQIGMYTDFN